MDNQPTNPTPTPAPEPTPAEPAVETPVNEAPVEEPVEAPAETAAEPVAEPEAPAEAPVEAPVEPEAPVEESVEAPAEPAAEPVAEPVAPVAEPVVPAEPVVESAAPAMPAMPAMPGVINPQPMAQAQGTAAPAKKNNTTLILGIILGIVVLAGVGVGVYMLLGNKDTKKPETTATPAAPVAEIKTVSCTASGAAWSILQEVVVDETEKKATEIGFTLKADYTKMTNTETTISTESEPDPEQAGLMVVALMAMAFQNAQPVDGVTIKDNSTETSADLTYRAVREEVEDEDTLKQFEENDGKTAAELKAEAEQSGATSGVTYSCTIK